MCLDVANVSKQQCNALNFNNLHTYPRLHATYVKKDPRCYDSVRNSSVCVNCHAVIIAADLPVL